MLSNRCKLAVKAELKALGLHFIIVDLGEVEIMEELSQSQRLQLKQGLQNSGLELIDDKKGELTNKIKTTILEMVWQIDENNKFSFTEYLSAQLNLDYTILSHHFSDIQGITIEKYIITQKIERAKEMLIYQELKISEIAIKLNYSSTAHLSNQFKKITGLSPSHFIKMRNKRDQQAEEIGVQPMNTTIVNKEKSIPA
ncbi:MAG: helix-turn-helix transcriptional regulator [Bacteroidetes bacterium]|nr:helix-turn-helix transcriptional regulator [Bacteroidota bacterium]